MVSPAPFDRFSSITRILSFGFGSITLLTTGALILHSLLPPHAILLFAVLVSVVGVLFALRLASGTALRNLAASLLLLVFGAGSSILVFAAIFLITGIRTSDGNTDDTVASRNHLTIADHVYFSAITWTTIGYGDLTPEPPSRAYAAIEGTLGSVYTGIITGVVFFHLSAAFGSRRAVDNQSRPQLPPQESRN